jgi:hypothetical protein
VAKRSGSTTKQLLFNTNGRAHHLISPPATLCSISKTDFINSASVKLTPTCFVVHLIAAYTVLNSRSAGSGISRATIGRFKNGYPFVRQSVPHHKYRQDRTRDIHSWQYQQNEPPHPQCHNEHAILITANHASDFALKA